MQRVSQRRQAWVDFATRATTRFESLLAKAQRLFEYLYVDSSTRAPSSKGTPNFVTLFWGQHPTGLYDFRAPAGTTSLDVEGGCALHFSQGPSGEVACIVYPFASALRTPSDRYYSYGVFSSPEEIQDKNIDNAVRTLFALAHYSSFAGNPAWNDWYAYTKLRVFSLLRRFWHGDWLKMMYSVLKKYLEEPYKTSHHLMKRHLTPRWRPTRKKPRARLTANVRQELG